jgi:hypothetical protein
MSGFAAPLRTKTPTPTFAKSTAERTLDRQGLLRESLNPGPELENSQGHERRCLGQPELLPNNR